MTRTKMVAAEQGNAKPFLLFKVTRETAERHFGKASQNCATFHVACKDEPYKEGDLVAAKFGDGWIVGKAKRKRKDILVGVWFEDDALGALEWPAWFPRSDVLPVVGLQTTVR